MFDTARNVQLAGMISGNVRGIPVYDMAEETPEKWNAIARRSCTINSREVAEMVEKRHTDLLRDIKTYSLVYLKALAPIYANGIAAERGEMFSCNDPAFVTSLIQNNNAELCLEPEERSLTLSHAVNSPFEKMTKQQLVDHVASIGLTGLKISAPKTEIISKILAFQDSSRGFKAMLRADINTVFINLDEFGERHIIKMCDNGKEKVITIVIDNDELMHRQSKKSIHDDGIFRAQVLFYCRGTDLGALPNIGSIIELDGKKYLVYDAKDDEGIYVIILERHASGGGL